MVAEVTGTELSKGALQVMTRELQRHDEQRVLRALARCMREIKGRLTLADGDRVDLTNLQRQILHTEARVGQSKALSGRQTLAALNPHVEIAAIDARLDGDALDAAVKAATVVLDCTDNFAARHAINRACVTHGRPLVSGAAVRFDGQLAVFDRRRAAAPCYACVFPEGEAQDELCAVMGVFAPVTGIIGTMQAAEALKLAAGGAHPVGQTLDGRLLLLDALTMTLRTLRVDADPGCSVCRRSQPAAG